MDFIDCPSKNFSIDSNHMPKNKYNYCYLVKSSNQMKCAKASSINLKKISSFTSLLSLVGKLRVFAFIK